MPRISHAWNQRCFSMVPHRKAEPTGDIVKTSAGNKGTCDDFNSSSTECLWCRTWSSILHPAHCPNSLNKIFLFIWVKQLSYWQCVNYPVRIPRRTATRHLLPEDIQHRSGNAKLKAIKQTRKLQYFRLASEALCLCFIFQCAWIHVVLKSIVCKHVDTHTRAKTSIVSLENCQYIQAEINVQREDESYWRTRPVSQIISDLEAWRSAR